MNSPKLPTIQHSAHDALFDDLEQELLEVTTASLDDDGSLPAPTSVDEFDNEFLAELSLTDTSHPPC